MKKLLFLSALVLCFGQTSLWAADDSKADIFGGFSVLHQPSFTPVGWQAEVTIKAKDKIGLVGDFGGAYKSGVKMHTYLGGAEVRQDAGSSASVFGHALFGGTTASGSTNFTMGYGGGLDIKATDKMSIRAIQFDWLPTRVGGAWFNNTTRYGFGVVYHAGK